MLLEFELENDGAFAEASTISLIASRLKDETVGRVISAGDPGDTGVLTSSLILGKNGSGKTTLVSAMRFVSSFVRSSANESRQDRPIAYEPNLLVGSLADKPTRYRVVFSMKGVIYDFEFSHNATRILTESLQVADKSVRFRKMYEREWKDASSEYVYSFGEALSGRRTIWQESTRDNALFISTASQLNSEDIKAPFRWLTRYLKSTYVSSESTGSFTARQCGKDEKFADKVVAFLKALDVNVEGLRIEEDPIDPKFLQATFAPEFIEKFVGPSEAETLTNRQKVYFLKLRNDGKTEEFPLSKESTGTRALFNLAGPLFDSLTNGYCLLIDEINTSLHPVVVSFLADLFADSRVNRKRAQLIFTSHDTSVLARHRMRRDQVWVIESDLDGAKLVPLSDFSPRRNEALDKGYLGGRYGGIPVVTPALIGNFCEAEGESEDN